MKLVSVANMLPTYCKVNSKGSVYIRYRITEAMDIKGGDRFEPLIDEDDKSAIYLKKSKIGHKYSKITGDYRTGGFIFLRKSLTLLGVNFPCTMRIEMVEIEGEKYLKFTKEK